MSGCCWPLAAVDSDAHAATNGNAATRGDAGADSDDAADPNASAGTAYAHPDARAPRRDCNADANGGGGRSPTPTLDASFTAEWERLIAAAQEEGKLVIAGGGGVQSIAPIYKIFEDKFGIKVVLGRGSSTEHANRILAEQAAGRFTVDVAHSGANSANVRYIANGMAQPIAPWIFHPEAAPENWFGDRWWWTDAEEKYHLVMTSSISSGSGGDFWWNTNNMSLEEVASWDYLARRVQRRPDRTGLYR